MLQVVLPEKKADLELPGSHMGVLDSPGFCTWMKLLDMVTRGTQSGTFIPKYPRYEFPMFKTAEEEEEFNEIVSESVANGKQCLYNASRCEKYLILSFLLKNRDLETKYQGILTFALQI